MNKAIDYIVVIGAFLLILAFFAGIRDGGEVDRPIPKTPCIGYNC